MHQHNVKLDLVKSRLAGAFNRLDHPVEISAARYSGIAFRHQRIDTDINVG
ncbi:hypothetical protein D3C73_1258050 [compost metagenome]